ncbi:MAG: putative ABC transporter F family member 3, partial [Streblomastix strix]
MNNFQSTSGADPGDREALIISETNTFLDEALGRGEARRIENAILKYIYNFLESGICIDGDSAYDQLGDLLPAWGVCIYEDCRMICDGLGMIAAKHNTQVDKEKSAQQLLAQRERLTKLKETLQGSSIESRVRAIVKPKVLGPQHLRKKDNTIKEGSGPDPNEEKFQDPNITTRLTLIPDLHDVVIVKPQHGDHSTIDEIRISDFSMSFGGKVLLDNANIFLQKQHRYGLIGRNGVGKSTLLRHIARGSFNLINSPDILFIEQEVPGNDATAIEWVLAADYRRTEMLKEESRLLDLIESTPGAAIGDQEDREIMKQIQQREEQKKEARRRKREKLIGIINEQDEDEKEKEDQLLGNNEQVNNEQVNKEQQQQKEEEMKLNNNNNDNNKDNDNSQKDKDQDKQQQQELINTNTSSSSSQQQQDIIPSPTQSPNTIQSQQSSLIRQALRSKKHPGTVTAPNTLSAAITSSSSSQTQQDAQLALSTLYEQMQGLQIESSEARAKQILKGLGFSDEDMTLPSKKFSGGWRMRISLGRALFREPTFLFLDEPTNHLDLPGSLFLEQYLKNYQRGLIIVSHDRYFLDRVCTDIVHFSNKKLTGYKGNFAAFEISRNEEKKRHLKAYEAQQVQIKHMERFIEINRAKNEKRANAAQSRQKLLDKIEIVEKPNDEEDLYSVTFRFPELSSSIKSPFLSLEEVTFAYQVGRSVLEKVSFTIGLNTRIALVGQNGAGKSTLLKLMARELFPSTGNIWLRPSLSVVRFSQHAVDEMPQTIDALQYLYEIVATLKEFNGPKGSEKLRQHLASFGVTGQMANQLLGKMS